MYHASRFYLLLKVCGTLYDSQEKCISKEEQKKLSTRNKSNDCTQAKTS